MPRFWTRVAVWPCVRRPNSPHILSRNPPTVWTRCVRHSLPALVTRRCSGPNARRRPASGRHAGSRSWRISGLACYLGRGLLWRQYGNTARWQIGVESTSSGREPPSRRIVVPRFVLAQVVRAPAVTRSGERQLARLAASAGEAGIGWDTVHREMSRDRGLECIDPGDGGVEAVDLID